MRKSKAVQREFGDYIDEYLYYCQSRRLRPKTMASYEQTLRLFERWTHEQEGLERIEDVRPQTIRHYICDLQVRGKYSFCITEKRLSKPRKCHNNQQLYSQFKCFLYMVRR